MSNMPSALIRDANTTDFDAICALNLAQVQHTSPMSVARLHELHQLAAYHKVVCVNESVVAFLLAMRNDAPYRNENVEWFLRKFPKFIYVDRIVVCTKMHGLRLGSLLYDDLFNWARTAGLPIITCEYNIFPANEASRLFHGKYGFKEQGRQWLTGGTKQVSLQVAET